MVDYLVREVSAQPIIGKQRIGIQCAFSSDMILDVSLHLLLAPIRDVSKVNFSTTLQHSHYHSLVLEPASGNASAPFFGVHVASLAADERFVCLYFNSRSAKFPQGAILHRKPNTVHHEPCGLLSDPKSTPHFVGTDSVLGVHNEPHGNHPFIHAERRILKDGTHLDGELFLASLTEPHAARRDKRVLRRIAARARYRAIRPAQSHGIVKRALRVREKDNCFLQRLGKLEGCSHG